MYTSLENTVATFNSYGPINFPRATGTVSFRLPMQLAAVKLLVNIFRRLLL